MPVFLQRLFASRKFWIAVFGLVQSVVFSLIPNFPRDVWVSIDALCGVLIGAIAYEDASQNAAKAQAVNVHLNAPTDTNGVFVSSMGGGSGGGVAPLVSDSTRGAE